ncbi:hypothetical protein [Flavimaricola marinus]|uniref:Uncharacterized protein n=1 Tax=Flavimaricola marinus TaxID=1819565 RepID=A0A238LAN6_9RHOB|nr:hypothetical protein [Flavimaricola marinus]SMY06623.1 hypothetical protein LOM8899_00750 [Flavimaricola marinus]
MSQTVENFDHRLKRVIKRHSRMRESGIVAKIGKDGLISAYPRRRMPSFPLRGFIILFAAAFLYKGFLLAYLGAATYDNRVTALAEGSIVEQAGAWFLQADPATQTVATVIKPFIPSP